MDIVEFAIFNVFFRENMIISVGKDVKKIRIFLVRVRSFGYLNDSCVLKSYVWTMLYS